MLPHKFPVTSGKKHSYDLYAMMHSAEEVGGDFYDFFLVDKNRLAIVIGDVSGVGLAAAIFMVVTKTLIHAWLKHGMPLDTAIMETNKQLYENNSRGIFVTVWAGMLDLHTGKLQFITAGQNPPLMKTGGKNFGVLATANDPPLGFAESPEYRIKQTLLQKDDTLFLYTDGVVNAFDNDGEQYGIDRLRDLMDNNSNMTMHELLTLIRKEVQTFSGGHPQADDLTMLGLRLC